MTKFKKLLVAGVAALGLLSMQAAPAGAIIPVIETAALGVFVGTATAPALFSPVSNDPACVAGGVPLLCPGGGGGWTFYVTGPSFGVDAGPVPSVPNSGPLTLPAVANRIAGTLSAGTAGLGAWCGYSRGDNGAGPLQIGTGPIVNTSEVSWMQSAATVIVFDGKAEKATAAADEGSINGVVVALPPNAATGGVGSCLAGSATQFTIVGAAVVLTTTA